MKVVIIIVMLLVFFSLLPVSAQECNDNIQASTPTSRFIDNGDMTITDRTTGLMWKKCCEGQKGVDCSDFKPSDKIRYTWQEGLQAAKTINVGGGFADYTDWRVPNIKELGSIVEVKCIDPRINTSVFPNTIPGPCWSSSSYVNDRTSAWIVDFLEGGFGGTGWSEKNSGFYSIRLVRGPQ